MLGVERDRVLAFRLHSQHLGTRPPARRLAAAADAYRGWARANPYRYELLFSVRPEGYSDPSEAIAAISGAMRVLLELLGEIAGDAAAAPASGGKLDAQLLAWGAREREHAGASSDDAEPPAPSPLVLRLGVLTWTRLHGIVMLELAGVVADMGLDAGLLVQAELDAVVAEARRG